MRIPLLLLLTLAGCTKPIEQVFIPYIPDLASGDLAIEQPDLAVEPDLAVQLDLAEVPNLVRPVDLAHCGDDGEPCCVGDVGNYCNQPWPALGCSSMTGRCASCGLPGVIGGICDPNELQPCCGGDPATHSGGTCESGFACFDSVPCSGRCP